MDFFNPLICQQIYGVPLGGIGTGSIGRSFLGDFCRYQLIPGLYEHNLVESNMFIVNIRKKCSTVYQQALTIRRSRLKGLRTWNMSFSGEFAHYYALYPESWTIYDLPGQKVKLTQHQLSPVIPNDYKDTSLPCGLFIWTCENFNAEEIELSLTFTWQSGSASAKFELTDVVSSSFKDYTSNSTQISGVIINQKLKNIPLEYCISAKKTVTKFLENSIKKIKI
jgi:non-lysosomal glucosylceramidase